MGCGEVEGCRQVDSHLVFEIGDSPPSLLFSFPPTHLLALLATLPHRPEKLHPLHPKLLVRVGTEHAGTPFGRKAGRNCSRVAAAAATAATATATKFIEIIEICQKVVATLRRGRPLPL